MVRTLDVMHLGRDRVIAAHEVRDGLIVDPGPASCLGALLGGLSTEPRALLLTHIHLDHAGASGSLARRLPGLPVFVHESGAPHLADPTRLLASARRLYGDDMDRLWGEVLPVPAQSIRPLAGGEEVEGFRVAHTPGHAGHHVSYLDVETGEAFVGDVAGVRIGAGEATVAPTPPFDIDVEAWERSLETVRAWRPEALRLTHFGRVDDAGAQLDRLLERLHAQATAARAGSHEDYLAWHEAGLAALDPALAARYRQAVSAEQCWLGLERYWRRRAPTRRGGD